MGNHKPGTLSRMVVRILAAILASALTTAQSADIPAGFEPLDTSFRAFLQIHALPGASLAIAKDGRLVFAQGYGFADVANARPAEPDSLFRFGSIGKTITAIAVMKLVESGKLSLDDKAFSILTNVVPHSGRQGDPRLALVTIRNLLTHSGGWDAAVSGDPIVAPFSQRIAAAMGVPFPPTPASIISYMLDRPLDFDPGTRFAYSNFGFLVLGRVIEEISGEPYADFVQQRILAPLSIRRMHLGRTPLSLRMPGEVLYYDYPGAPLVDSLMPDVPGKVSEPYSGIVALESIDSAGAWIASPIDLVRIVTMLDGWGVPALLSPESVQQMVTPYLPFLASAWMRGTHSMWDWELAWTPRRRTPLGRTTAALSVRALSSAGQATVGHGLSSSTARPRALCTHRLALRISIPLCGVCLAARRSNPSLGSRVTCFNNIFRRPGRSSREGRPCEQNGRFALAETAGTLFPVRSSDGQRRCRLS